MRWDLASKGTLVPGVQYEMSMVDGLASGPPRLLIFAAHGNYTAVDAATGARVWSVVDPLSLAFPSRAAAPPSGAFHGQLFMDAGGNGGDPQGSCALSAASGAVIWTQNATVGISDAGFPTTQGWMWTSVVTGSSYEEVFVLDMADGATLASGYFPSYFGRSFQFGSNAVVSGDGLRLYMFGSCNPGVCRGSCWHI